MARSIRVARVLVAGVFLSGMSLHAQLKWGETSTKGTANLSSGYSATYGNMAQSSHGWTMGGSGTFSGSFHSPNFLSYNFSPYLNQSRANSNFQSITNSSGLNLSANIFAGSKFKGYSKYGNVDAKFTDINDSRAVSLSFTWRFNKGKLKAGSGKKEGGASDEQGRVKTGN